MLWNSRRGRLSGDSPWKCRRIAGKPGREATGSIILVHGLFLFGFCLTPLARRFARDGYDVYLCDYQTRRFGIREHARHFLSLLDSIAKRTGGEDGSLHIVTHSLGGIIARAALAELERDSKNLESLKPSMIGRTVMMAPPNNGSDMARRLSGILPWPGRFAKPLPELSSAPEAEIHSIPKPKSFEIGIIAGSRDIEVAWRQTELEGAAARKELSSGHTLMPFYPHVYRELSHFIRNGRFCD